MPISKELIEISKLPWFPKVMKELGYEPVRYGRWKQSKHYQHIIVCDECGEPYELSNSIEHWNYCPNCGAKMDEEDKDAKTN